MVNENLESLTIKTSLADGSSVVFQRDGSQGNRWRRAQVAILSDTEYTLILEGSIGGGIKSDIAIDDISFTDGPCGKRPSIY